MNTTILMATVILLPLLFLTMLILVRRKRSLQKRQGQLMNRLEQLLGASIPVNRTVELFHNKLIAIDDRRRQLLFIHIKEEQEQSDIIPLEQITECQVVKQITRIPGTRKNATEDHINAILLQILKAGKEPVSLPIYNEIEDGGMELLPRNELAEKWKQIINTSILTRQPAL